MSQNNRIISWIGSRQLCKKAGCDLVSIESPQEWLFIKQTIQNLKTVEYFIGLRQDLQTGEWRWISDNSPVPTSSKGKWPWARGEPNKWGVPHTCVLMYKDYNSNYGLYNNVGCHIRQRLAGFICEGTRECHFEEIK